MSRPLRAGFVSEGVHGHVALQARLERLVEQSGNVEPWFATVPAPGRLEAMLVRRVERLGELDLHALRWRLRYSLRARQLIEARGGADVLFVNSQACALLARAPMARAPWVLAVDATARQFARLEYWRPRDRFSPIGERALDGLERRAYRGAAAVLAFTEWTAESLRRDYRVPDERIAVMHPGVEIPPDRRTAGERRDAGGPLRLLFVGNGVRRKGLDVLRAALADVDVATQLDVVTGDEVSSGAGMTVHGGLSAESPELARLYADADILALPSRADVAPHVILEGMAAGIPVLATSVGAIPELVGDAGMIVAPGDSQALALAVHELAADPERRRLLGERGRRRARERYDVVANTVRLVELLRRAAERPMPEWR